MDRFVQILYDISIRYEVALILVLNAFFWIRVFVNSSLINSRDNTNHFILFLSPFSLKSFGHGIESMFRFYWNPNGERKKGKKLVNYLSVLFLISVLILISSSLVLSANEIDLPYKGELIKVKNDEYNKFILAKNTSIDYTKELITEYGTLNGDKDDLEILDFGFVQYDDWTVIYLPDNLHFYYFHNLATWLYGYDDNPNQPYFIIGYAKYKGTHWKDYIFYADPQSEYGDTQIGAFYDDEEFFVYLPKAYYSSGNIMLTRDLKIDYSAVLDSLVINDLLYEYIDLLTPEFHEIKMSKINGH